MSDQPPEQKNGLLELLKNLWVPAAGFIGAVTLAYNFCRLWFGDDAAITYFLAAGGFLVLMIALIWVGFKVSTVTRDATIVEKIPAYPRIYQRTARIILVIVFLGSLIG